MEKQCSKIELGTIDMLTYFRELARKGDPVNFEIFIVQSGLSSKEAFIEQLSLLGVASCYLKSKGAVTQRAIGSS